jgi:hypothetical protein
MAVTYKVMHKFSWALQSPAHSHGSYDTWEEADRVRQVVQNGPGNQDDDVWILAEKGEEIYIPKERPSEQERNLIHSLTSLMAAAGASLVKWEVLTEDERHEFVMRGYSLHKEFFEL